MLEDKKETPSLVIPKSILQFASTPTYQLFLFSLYEYCCSYHAAVCKYSSLREKMLDRVYDGVILLQREKEGLLKMEQELVKLSIHRAISTQGSF